MPQPDAHPTDTSTARGRARASQAGERPRATEKAFVEGRYRKLTRDLPQTVFYCPKCKGHPRRRKGCAECEGFGKLTKDSVQELVAWVAGKAFGTRKNKFHGAGREDVDVRMLGPGRPFVLELLNPKTRDVDLAELEAEINRRNAGRLEIVQLHWTEKARIRAVKETPHAKRYGALVGFESAPDDARLTELLGQRIEVVQETPKRVAHRRAQLDRTRWIEFVAFEPAEDGDPLHRYVELRTQHGTYVKEVLSGEGGRTRPSLGELSGTPCTCLELDVLEILDESGDEAGAEAELDRSRPPSFGAGIL